MHFICQLIQIVFIQQHQRFNCSILLNVKKNYFLIFNLFQFLLFACRFFIFRVSYCLLKGQKVCLGTPTSTRNLKACTLSKVGI